MAAFKDGLKKLRIKNNLTLKALGKKLGYSQSTISMYESGNRLPKKPEDYIRIADFFNVTLEYLFGRNNDKNSLSIQSKKPLSLYQHFVNLLIENDKINSEKDLTLEKIFEILNEIFNNVKT